jgi:hypothetical protein
MTKVFFATMCVLAVAGPGWSADCSGLAKQLNSLRLEYKEYAAKTDKASITFDGLTEILDKIVKVKGEMSKAGCKKIPPRK